jgi:hypothetical protein
MRVAYLASIMLLVLDWMAYIPFSKLFSQLYVVQSHCPLKTNCRIIVKHHVSVCLAVGGGKVH